MVFVKQILPVCEKVVKAISSVVNYHVRLDLASWTASLEDQYEEIIKAEQLSLQLDPMFASLTNELKKNENQTKMSSDKQKDEEELSELTQAVKEQTDDHSLEIICSSSVLHTEGSFTKEARATASKPNSEIAINATALLSVNVSTALEKLNKCMNKCSVLLTFLKCSLEILKKERNKTAMELFYTTMQVEAHAMDACCLQFHVACMQVRAEPPPDDTDLYKGPRQQSRLHEDTASVCDGQMPQGTPDAVDLNSHQVTTNLLPGGEIGCQIAIIPRSSQNDSHSMESKQKHKWRNNICQRMTHFFQLLLTAITYTLMGHKLPGRVQQETPNVFDSNSQANGSDQFLNI